MTFDEDMSVLSQVEIGGKLYEAEIKIGQDDLTGKFLIPFQVPFTPFWVESEQEFVLDELGIRVSFEIEGVEILSLLISPNSNNEVTYENPNYMPPQIVVLNPNLMEDTGQIFEGIKGDSFEISATASTGGELDHISISINGVIVELIESFNPSSTGSISFHINTDAYPIGDQFIEIKAADKIGYTNSLSFVLRLFDDPQTSTVIPFVTSNYDTFSLEQGNEKTIRFNVKNEGTGSTIPDEGQLAISVSDGLEILSYNAPNGGVVYNLYEPGDWETDRNGNFVQLQYDMLQAKATYGPGDEKIIDVTFQATSAGTHFIKYRAIFAYDDDGLNWANYPVSGSIFPPQNWPVETINVSEPGVGPAVISIAPEQFNFGTVGENKTEQDYLYIQNTGGETLNWSVTNHPNWISLNTDSGSTGGGQTSTVTVTVNTEELSHSPTPYTSAIVISSNAGNPITIPVEIIVTELSVLPKIYAFQDTYVHGDNQTTIYGSFDYMEVGEKNSVGAMAFVQFDISNIPTNVNIESAKVFLYAYDVDTSDDNKIKVNRLDNFPGHPCPWAENDVTWENYPGILSPVQTVSSIDGEGWVSFDITTLAQQWYFGWRDNYGLSLRPNIGGNGIWTKFHSSEYSDQAKRPHLEITYTQVNPDFLVNLTPNPNKISNPGDVAEFDITVQSVGGFSGDVFFDLFGNLPPDSTPQFEVNPISTGGNTMLTIDTLPSTPKGIYQFTIRGTSSGKSHNVNITLQVGENLGPALTIHSITENNEPSGTIKINYTATDQNNNPMTTKDWQFSLDSTNGADGTWMSISSDEIGNNIPKASGIDTFITWDTTAGANNLSGVQINDLWFRMKVDTGIPVMAVIKDYAFSGGMDFEGISYNPNTGRIWSTEDASCPYTEVHEHNADENLSVLNSYDYCGMEGYQTQSHEPYGIVWINNNNQGNQQFLVADNTGGEFHSEGVIFKFVTPYADQMPPNYYDYYRNLSPSQYADYEFQGLAWDGSTVWSCITDSSNLILKHNPGDYEIVDEVYPSPASTPSGITLDDNNIWTCDRSTWKIYKHNMDSTLSVVSEYSLSYQPTGLTWDGINIYSCTEDHIYKHNMSPPESSFVAYGPALIDNNLAPVMSSLPDQNIDEDNHNSGALDLWTYTTDLEESQSSLEYSIIGVSHSECGASIRDNRWIDLYPLGNWNGVSDVIAQVSDGFNIPVSQTITVHVNPINDPPSINQIENIIFDENSTLLFQFKLLHFRC